MRRNRIVALGTAAMFSLGLLIVACSSGCQSDMNGQVLPSAYYNKDNVQYFPAGTENKLANESAAMNAYRQNQGMQPMSGQACSCSSCSGGKARNAFVAAE